MTTINIGGTAEIAAMTGNLRDTSESFNALHATEPNLQDKFKPNFNSIPLIIAVIRYDNESSHTDRDRSDRRGGPIDFERHRAKLAKIFFREGDLIQHGSDEYRDFWKLLRRYQAFEASKAKKGRNSRAPAASNSSYDLDPVLDISSWMYDKNLSQSFNLLPRYVPSLKLKKTTAIKTFSLC